MFKWRTGKFRDEVVHSREGRVAGPGISFTDTICIRETEHINGGGPECFGGAPSWPVLEIVICFPAGTSQDKLDGAVKALQKTIDEIKPD